MLTSAKDMLLKAHKEGYGVAHININNLEWIKAVLQEVEELKSPVILGVSEGAAKYMGGYRNVVAMVTELDKSFNISVPVAIHLDHGTYEGAKKALEAGFTSIMFDGSAYPFKENLEKTKEIVALCKAKGVSVEAEVGAIGGEEDGVIGAGEIADPEECRELASTGIDMFAAGIGNIHGKYPANWKGLDFEVLAEVQRVTNGLPLVLHGGSGIPEAMVKKAISLGVSKINVNTECQLAFAAAVRKYIEEGKDLQSKGFDPRKLLAPGVEAIKKVVREKITLFGSVNKA
ncbi:Fructose-1,6-bisphosphate aldolase [Alteracholeplasma palmae J233]|uniref:Fructose-1,6-bisphosphate aldolase n=1 Tax=Alteracholeplasma palmae (strain ATCC 49389 / J233) TaxID=1318466 RepID=U4KQQ3_ALTPJ|nr:class II fructose-1,6-bisphosphate aldolase [Alteracholeplasma palmae]CCV64980.1 Fructose-1,6-bisphosphate aldolase [Alteracholeplasma palmae J233]